MAVDPVQVANGHRREVHLRLVSQVGVGDDWILKKLENNVINTGHGEVSKHSKHCQPNRGSYSRIALGRVVDPRN